MTMSTIGTRRVVGMGSGSGTGTDPTPPPSTGDWQTDGHALLPALLSRAECADIAAQRDEADAAGTRCLLSQPWCADLARRLRSLPALAALMPRHHVAVQCSWFEKSPAHNWLVAIHQDLSIPVAQRVESPVLRGWSAKEGALFVQPPVDLLESLVALRLHLDDCGADDGPLRVVPRSHGRGRIAPDDAIALRDACGDLACVADSGDALVMRPLLLHASSKSSPASRSRRRVLHFVFGPPALPFGLAWPLTV